MVAIIAIPYPLAQMLTANYFGTLSDRTGRKKMIVFGTALASFIFALYALWANVWYLAALHGIHGIAAAATVAPAIAMIADHAESTDRGRQMGWFDYSTTLGYIVGAVVGGLLIDAVNVRLGFLLMAGILAASALIFFILVEQEKVERKAKVSSLAELRKVFKNSQIRWIFPIWLIVAILLGLVLTFLPIILLSLNVTGASIGLLFATAAAAFGLLQPLWGKVSDVVGRVPVIAYGIISMFGIIIQLFLFPDTVYHQSSTGYHLNLLGVIPLAIMGLGVGAFVPSALAMMADSSDTRSYGTTMGLYSFALGFGAFIAETLGLVIILIGGTANAPTWLLYLAITLTGLAVLILAAYFLTHMGARKTAKEQS